MRRGGIFVASIHVETKAGERYCGREDRIDVDKTYFLDLAAQAGFSLHEDLGSLCGQETLVFARC